MTNPLLQKWEELYGKKEEPKPQEIKTTYTKDELEALAPYINTNSNKITVNSNGINYINATNATVSARPITSYDLHSSEHIFLEVAEKVRTKDAKVSSMSVNIDSVGIFTTGLQTFTFEVMVYNTPWLFEQYILNFNFMRKKWLTM